MLWFGAKTEGAYGVAIVWIIAQPLLLCAPLYSLREELGVSVRAYFARLIPAFLTTAAMLLSATLSERIAPASGLLHAFVVASAASLTFAVVLALPYRRRVTALWKSLTA